MNQFNLTKTQIKNLAIPLVDKVTEQVQEFYKNPDNEQRFRNWYEKTYGRPVPEGV